MNVWLFLVLFLLAIPLSSGGRGSVITWHLRPRFPLLTSSKLVVASDTTSALSPLSQPQSGQCAVEQLHLTQCREGGWRLFCVIFFIFGFRSEIPAPLYIMKNPIDDSSLHLPTPPTYFLFSTSSRLTPPGRNHTCVFSHVSAHG